MEKAVIILSIDDGRADMYRLAKELLIPRKIPATLNITTNSEFFKKFTQIKRDELLEIAKYPFLEIANHSAMHTNEFDDIKRGHLDLCSWLGRDEKEPLGFASPCSKMSFDYIKENIEALREVGVKYVRTCKYGNFFNTEEDTVALKSYPVIFTTPLEEMKKMTDMAVEMKCCLIYIFHSITKPGDDLHEETYSYDFDRLAEWISYLEELRDDGKIEILTTEEYFDRMTKKG